MAFRDDLGAAQLRSDKLSEELEALRASNEASAAEGLRLERELAQAKREVERLREHQPGSVARRRGPYRTVLFVALGLAIATAVAGYQSETLGVNMSYLTAALLGAGGVGWVTAARSPLAGVAGAILGAIAVVALLAAFYIGIWPSL